MATELHIYDGGTWRNCSEVHIYDGSAWRNCSEVYVYDGSAWRKAFGAAVVTVSGEFVNNSGSGTVYSGIRVNSDGTIDKRLAGGGYSQIDSSTDWIIPNSAASSKTYHARLTPGVGDTLDYGTASSWTDISTSPEWGYADTLDKLGTFTLAISDDGGSTTLDSASYTFSTLVL